MEVKPQDISWDFQLFSNNQKLGIQIKCFGSTESLITGNSDVDAQVMARGAIEEVGKSLNGTFEVTARDGH